MSLAGRNHVGKQARKPAEPGQLTTTRAPESSGRRCTLARVTEPQVLPGSDPTPDALAAELRGFGPIGLLAILAIVAASLVIGPVSAALVLLWAYRSRTPWSELGLARPRSWTRTLLAGIVFGAALKLFMKSVVMPLLGADPVNRSYQHLAGNIAALPGTLFMVIVVAGFGEEVLFRGYLFERLGRLWGSRVPARVALVLLTSVLFGFAHLSSQGVAAVQQAAVTGLVMGTIFAVTRSLWLPIVIHTAFDVTATWIIYANLETTVARWFFP